MKIFKFDSDRKTSWVYAQSLLDASIHYIECCDRCFTVSEVPDKEWGIIRFVDPDGDWETPIWSLNHLVEGMSYTGIIVEETVIGSEDVCKG